jgi:hypothetical protein
MEPWFSNRPHAANMSKLGSAVKNIVGPTWMDFTRRLQIRSINNQSTVRVTQLVLLEKTVQIKGQV